MVEFCNRRVIYLFHSSSLGLFQYIIVYWCFGSLKWKREIEWMTNKGKALWRTIFQSYLLATWTVISPIMITGILGFYLYDVIALHPPQYRHWNSESVK